MATLIWKGDAHSIAQATRCTLGGTIELGDVFTLAVGSKELSVAATSTSAADIAAAIVAAWNALPQTTHPEFVAIAASDAGSGALDLTAKVAGVPFSVTLSTTESGGGEADSQTFTQSTIRAAIGGAFWKVAANW